MYTILDFMGSVVRQMDSVIFCSQGEPNASVQAGQKGVGFLDRDQPLYGSLTFTGFYLDTQTLVCYNVTEMGNARNAPQTKLFQMRSHGGEVMLQELERVNAPTSFDPEAPAEPLSQQHLCEMIRSTLQDEVQDRFDTYRTTMISKFRPSGRAEEALVDQIIAYGWRLDRVVATQTELLNYDPEEGETLVSRFLNRPRQRQLLALARSEESIEKRLFRAIRQFQEQRKLRLRWEGRAPRMPDPSRLEPVVIEGPRRTS